MTSFLAMPKDLISFCESLWQDWLANRLDTSPFVKRAFDLDAAPEPYISFGCGQNPLVFLTTNPGSAMREQKRAQVKDGCRPLSLSSKYEEAAKELGAFYERKLAGRPAGRRIAAMQKLSSRVGADGVLQVEMCPFHSPSLPNKIGLLEELDKGDLLRRYVEEVRAFLVARPVVALSAASSGDSMGSGMHLSPWAMRLSEVAGLDLERADFVRLVMKKEKVTAMALVSSRGGVPKALVLMMGGNHLPAEEGLRVLANAFRRQFWQSG